MPRLSIRAHGASASIPLAPSLSSKQPEKRSLNTGWSLAVARRNNRFLQSIDFDAIQGRAYEITLTLPVRAMGKVTPEMMHRMIDTMLKHLKRRGLLYFHWVIEFTASHMPHIHMTVWMSGNYRTWDRYSRCYVMIENTLAVVTMNVVGKWLALSQSEGLYASARSQDVQELDGDSAWLAYVSRHTQRGIKHYQRALTNMPSGWRMNPGAMWGHSRDMPLAEESLMPMSMAAFHQFRREVRKWCSSRAAMISDPSRRARAIRQARRMNRCNLRELSAVRPISVWLPREVVVSIVRGLRARRYMIGPDAYEWGMRELEKLRENGSSPERQRALEQELLEMQRW